MRRRKEEEKEGCVERVKYHWACRGNASVGGDTIVFFVFGRRACVISAIENVMWLFTSYRVLPNNH